MTAAEIQRYWDERAQLHPESATTDDFLLRDLEFRELSRRIERIQPATVLDIGCGDGRTTIRLAQKFRKIQFRGIDYAQGMINLATQFASPLELPNLTFDCQDLFNCTTHADLAITTRVLINLESPKAQEHALDVLAGLATDRVLIENFIGPHYTLNTYRALADLPATPIRLHNLYLDSSIASRGFADAYYFVSRVAYSRMCATTGEPLRYDHPICQAAAEISQDIGIAVAPMRVITL